ncbi:MAG: DUF433 domain-containing protein [Patescibacteria group bacterium]
MRRFGGLFAAHIGNTRATWYDNNMEAVRNYIHVNPTVCHGQPHFAHTRILVHTVLELLEAGEPVEEITGASYYPMLTEKHIAAALHYASELLKTRAYVPQTALR